MRSEVLAVLGLLAAFGALMWGIAAAVRPSWEPLIVAVALALIALALVGGSRLAH